LAAQFVDCEASAFPGSFSYQITKRMLDFFGAFVLLIAFSPLMLILAVAIRLTSSGGAIYWSDRIGRGNKVFRMPKFRSMRVGTPVVATRMLRDPTSYLTPLGSLIRRTSLDELPQLWSILRGDISFVGPRPVLTKEYRLTELRTAFGVHTIRPGLTGWAQINGRDTLTDETKAKLDCYYMNGQSFAFDMMIVGTTILKVLRCEGVQH
jgi:O-antigen biosynthesis protein WbqP